MDERFSRLHGADAHRLESGLWSLALRMRMICGGGERAAAIGVASIAQPISLARLLQPRRLSTAWNLGAASS